MVITNTSLTKALGSTVTLTTSGGSGNGAVTFDAAGTGCLIATSVLSSTGAATCVVTATKAASAGYLVTSSASVTFVFASSVPTPSVGSTVQTITLVTPTAIRVGKADQVLIGQPSSNLPLVFTSNSEAICTIATGSRVSVVHAVAGGMCSVTASQAGDATYAAASVTVLFHIVSSGDASQFILVLDLNGGTLNGSSAITSQIVASSAGAQTLGTPTNGSMTFQGWHVSDVAGLLVSDPYTVSADTVLVAKWA